MHLTTMNHVATIALLTCVHCGGVVADTTSDASTSDSSKDAEWDGALPDGCVVTFQDLIGCRFQVPPTEPVSCFGGQTAPPVCKQFSFEPSDIHYYCCPCADASSCD